MRGRFGVVCIVLVGLAGISPAQITVEFDDFPFQLGAVVTRGYGSNAIAPGPVGGDRSWNYAAQAVAYEATESYVDPAGQPGADTFPDATLAMSLEYDGQVGELAYFREVGGNLEMVGFALISGGNTYPVPVEVSGPRFAFPISYGASWDYVTTTEFGADTHVDSTRFVVDAWGTMTEAAGTFACLRLRMDNTHTVYPANDVSTKISYMWIARNWGELCRIDSTDGETDPDFDNGGYERVSENSGGTPVLLNDFEAVFRDGGVDLSWQVREPRPGRFALSARRDDRTWPVALDEGLGGWYSARDEAAWLQAGGEVVYTLSLDEEAVYTSSVSLDTPVAPAVLWGAAPNPFNPRTVVSFSIVRGGHVDLAVYDLTGHRVATLADRGFPAGWYELTWLGVDGFGAPAPSGTYVVRLRTDRSTTAKKVTLLR